jgi:hypothetical protein
MTAFVGRARGTDGSTPLKRAKDVTSGQRTSHESSRRAWFRHTSSVEGTANADPPLRSSGRLAPLVAMMQAAKWIEVFIAATQLRGRRGTGASSNPGVSSRSLGRFPHPSSLGAPGPCGPASDRAGAKRRRARAARREGAPHGDRRFGADGSPSLDASVTPPGRSVRPPAVGAPRRDRVLRFWRCVAGSRR